jgi:hypothetical protein
MSSASWYVCIQKSSFAVYLIWQALFTAPTDLKNVVKIQPKKVNCFELL